jgi:hypothetical protein
LSEGGATDASEAKRMAENKDEEKKVEATKEEETKEEEKKEDGKKEEETKDEKTENEEDSKPMDVDKKDADVEMKDATDQIKSPEQDASPKKEERKDKELAEFDISASKGYDLLSKREIELCLRLKIYPVQYLEIKKALIFESMRKGLLDNEAAGSARRTIVKVDVEKRGNIIDFMVRAGWISTSLGKAARSVNSSVSVNN